VSDQPIPAAPHEITAQWLTAVLREARVLRRGIVIDVRVEIIGADWGFTGMLARLRPCYEGADADTAAPPSLIAKLPMAPRDIPSTFSAQAESDPAVLRQRLARGAREVKFYRHIAPLGLVPVPTLYYAAADAATGRVMLLLEDVREARVGDVLRGCTPEEAGAVLRTVAPLHARWWERADEHRFPWAPAWAGDIQARQDAYNGRLGPFLARYGALLPAPAHALLDRLRTRYGTVLAALAAAPATLIHADLHLDNILFRPPDGNPPVVVLDWQSISRGPAAVDVAAFVFGSLPPERRGSSVDELLCGYHARLAGPGVAGYTLAQLREHCRWALLWQLAGTVGWLGSVASTGDEPAGREGELVRASLADGRLISALIEENAASLMADE
jgi:aminoglycoside phosphotransferase (APT) family kinase protein